MNKALGCIKITELRIRNIKWEDHKRENKVDTVIYRVFHDFMA